MGKLDINNHKLINNLGRVAEWNEKGDCYPIYIEIGPTNACNHNCVFCALDWVGNGKIFIDKDVMTKNLEDMAEHGVKYIMFAGEGEPLLHKDIGLFTKISNESGIETTITTNGIPLNQRKREECLPYLKWIRFSIDSGSDKNYSLIHGTKKEDFKKVMNNIERAVQYKDKMGLDVEICAQFLMIPQNSGEVINLAKKLSDIGADHLQVKPYSHHPQSNNSFIINPSVYKKIEGELKKINLNNFEVKFREEAIENLKCGISYPKCYALPFFALIDSKGNILPCNLFYNNEEFTYGNLYQNSFTNIWKGDKRKKIIEKLNDKGVGECREGCRLDSWNRYLQNHRGGK